jgi:hypothetical protein
MSSILHALDFTDAIHDAWGEKPFTDMINGWKYVLGNYPEVDPDRAVGAGPSWGGYCIKSVSPQIQVLSITHNTSVGCRGTLSMASILRPSSLMMGYAQTGYIS